MIQVTKMEHIFKSTVNTRPVFENSLRYIRSEVPTEVTEDEKEWMIENNILTIVDLRSAPEREARKCPLAEDTRFSYHCFPITNGNIIPHKPDDVSKSYISMADGLFEELIAFLQSAKTNVLYFCAAGKDRTGITSAVLLLNAGIDRSYIVDNYVQSKDTLKELLIEFANANPGIDLNVITPQRRYIEEFLDWYIANK